MKHLIKQILREEVVKTEWEYQVRDIDGPVYYKRQKNTHLWDFTDELDYYKNSNKNNRIKWRG